MHGNYIVTVAWIQTLVDSVKILRFKILLSPPCKVRLGKTCHVSIDKAVFCVVCIICGNTLSYPTQVPCGNSNAHLFYISLQQYKKHKSEESGVATCRNGLTSTEYVHNLSLFNDCQCFSSWQNFRADKFHFRGTEIWITPRPYLAKHQDSNVY